MTDKETEEPKYPFVKFARIKRIRKAADAYGKAEEKPEIWYLNVSGVHNQVEKLDKFERQGSKVIGSGNLEQKNPAREDKFKEMRNAVARKLGANNDPRLNALVDAPTNALAEKVAREQKRGA